MTPSRLSSLPALLLIQPIAVSFLDSFMEALLTSNIAIWDLAMDWSMYIELALFNVRANLSRPLQSLRRETLPP